MAELSTKRRKALPKSEFALPAQRAYPIDTKARAANAKARASQQFDAGWLSKTARDKVFRAANRVLYGSAKAPKGRA